MIAVRFWIAFGRCFAHPVRTLEQLFSFLIRYGAEEEIPYPIFVSSSHGVRNVPSGFKVHLSRCAAAREQHAAPYADISATGSTTVYEHGSVHVTADGKATTVRIFGGEVLRENYSRFRDAGLTTEQAIQALRTFGNHAR